MKFGSRDTKDAIGAILAHSINLPDGRLRKGQKITVNDSETLLKAGVETVVVAELDSTDIEENEAATRVASSLANSGCVAETAFTGRANIYAAHDGLFQADAELITRLNRLSPAITLATLNTDTIVRSGRMVATVKIIPFAAKATDVQACETLLDSTDALSIKPFQPATVMLIQTTLPDMPAKMLDKTARVLAERLTAMGATLESEIRIEHAAPAVAEALVEAAAKADLVIVFGASAIADEHDVIPAGLERAGGRTIHFGMPVDPGNLLLIGELEGTTIIGAPGCARSPAENGFDWVLARVLAGAEVDHDYLTGLGVGGLLMEISSRPQPREKDA